MNAYSDDVFPFRSLPGQANDWGRRAELFIEAIDWNLDVLHSTLDNTLRPFVGQLEALGNELRELTEGRVIISRALDGMTFTSNTVSSFTQHPMSFTLPGAFNGPRYGVFDITTGVSNTTSSESCKIWLELVVNGQRVWHAVRPFFTGPGFGPGTLGVDSFFSARIPFQIPATAMNCILRFWVHGDTSAPKRIVVSNTSVTLNYGSLT